MSQSIEWVQGWWDRYRVRYRTGLPTTAADRDLFMDEMLKEIFAYKVTSEEADSVLLMLVDDPPQKGAEHLQKFRSALKKVRNHRDAQRPAGGPLSDRENYEIRTSDGCPECTYRGKATGWAKRRWYWLCGTIPILFCEMFCRCPYGRWRKVQDPTAAFHSGGSRGERRHDLQAFPELWDYDMNHDSWTDAFVRDDVPADPSTDGQWRYLAPHESTPKIAATSVVKNLGRDRSWLDRGGSEFREATAEEIAAASERRREFERRQREPAAF